MNVCRLLSKNDSSFFGLLFFIFRMRIVDDDVSWTSISTTKAEKEEEEDDGDLPVVCIFLRLWGLWNASLLISTPNAA